MQLRLYLIQLKFKEPFTIARGSYSAKKALIVELNNGTHKGYGEACEHSYYGVEVPDLIDLLESHRSMIESYDGHDPEAFWHKLDPFLHHHPFAQCALDVAAHDLYGKIKGKALYQLWGLNQENVPITDYTIGIDTIEKMIAKIDAFPFPVYKIKLGTRHDLEIMRAIRAHTNARLRVDANTGWTVQQTIEYARELKRLDVEFIEQPLPADDWEGMKEVYEQSVLPVIADEACVRETDVDLCAGYFHGINIKLMKCSGITPARRMIDRARQLGLQIMMGCMTEGSIGISAIAQFLPLLDYVDMDGTLLISNDPAEGVVINPDGTVNFPDVGGTGVRLKEGFRR